MADGPTPRPPRRLRVEVKGDTERLAAQLRGPDVERLVSATKHLAGAVQNPGRRDPHLAAMLREFEQRAAVRAEREAKEAELPRAPAGRGQGTPR
jgi:hypothetical protein